MSIEVKLPSLGEGVASGDVLEIFVKEGDTISKDQSLLELETDKATVSVPSPTAGKILKIVVSEGETVAVGAPIAVVEPSSHQLLLLHQHQHLPLSNKKLRKQSLPL